jgi:hypothetical protein
MQHPPEVFGNSDQLQAMRPKTEEKPTETTTAGKRELASC